MLSEHDVIVPGRLVTLKQLTLVVNQVSRPPKWDIVGVVNSRDVGMVIAMKGKECDLARALGLKELVWVFFSKTDRGVHDVFGLISVERLLPINLGFKDERK